MRDLRHKWMVGCAYINPDDIAEHELGGWNDPNSIRQAAALVTERRETCLRKRKDFAFETVFSSSEKLDFLRRAHQCGFFIRLFFVDRLCAKYPRTPQRRAANLCDALAATQINSMASGSR